MRITEALPHLPAAVARQTLDTLVSLLPHPATDTPEDRAVREQVAIDAVAALRPANAFEAVLAAQIVGAQAHAMECLRLAVQPGQTPEAILRCRSNAAAMMRQMQRGLRTLQRMQAARKTADTAPAPGENQKVIRAGHRFRRATVPPGTKPRLLH